MRQHFPIDGKGFLAWPTIGIVDPQARNLKNFIRLVRHLFESIDGYLDDTILVGHSMPDLPLFAFVNAVGAYHITVNNSPYQIMAHPDPRQYQAAFALSPRQFMSTYRHRLRQTIHARRVRK